MLRKDFKNPVSRSAGHLPGGTALSGTTASNGAWVNVGPAGNNPVVCVFHAGAATGSPTSYAIALKVQQADDGSGTNAEDVTGATASVTAAGVTVIQPKLLTRPYIRLVATPAFSGGSSPTLPVSSLVEYLKETI